MITVIIAGGSGTRLWPLSTPDYPKHLLKLTDERTMLQQTYERAALLGDEIYVITEASHAHHVKEQLSNIPEDHFIIEPGRRGTAHCIIMALDVISRVHSEEEPIAFIHSDHHVRDKIGFKRSFAVAGACSKENNAITLFGIEPTFPATGFGYIQRDSVVDASRSIYHVQSFKEKPDYDTAQKYVDSGNYLWNCGYFVGSVKTFLKEMADNAPELKSNMDTLRSIADISSSTYKNTYLGFENEVIDVALIEKAKHLIVVSANFDWMDVGSFKDLHDAVKRDHNGNHIRGKNINTLDVENVYIRNEEDKPIAVIGLDNVVVVNTPDGILVTRKDISHRAGEIAKKIQAEK